MAISCASCQQANPHDATFCGECGASLNTASPCPTCGRPNPAPLKFCRGCGSRLTATIAALEPTRPRLAAPVAFAGGRYQLQRLLGEGSKKLVYLAHDSLLNRLVALSLFKGDRLDQNSLIRIQREAQALAQLGDHPHIVTLYDAGEDHGQPYFVSQYMAGGTLQEYIERAQSSQPLSIAQTLTFAEQLCQALVHAHQHGVIHRDLKPSNVWLTEDQLVKLGDFGLATSLDHSRLTLEGVLVGTAAYVPPEHLQGKKLDARSDLYSLGVILYEMASGRPPFVGDSLVSLIAQHLHAKPVAPSHHNPEVAQALDTFILSLLAKEPNDRPQSAKEVAHILQTLTLAGETKSPSVAAAPAHALDGLANEIFVGRDYEMDLLREKLEEALAGHSRVVLLLGEPGIGKTRLATEVATYAQLRGARVLMGRCHEDEGAPPYWPWMQMVRTYTSACPLYQLRSELGAGAVDIARVIPAVRESLPDLPVPPTVDPEQARFRFFDSFTQFLQQVTQRQPLVLLMDDLQWADVSSLKLLQFLAREVGEMRLLVLLTCREEAITQPHSHASALGALLRAPGSYSITLHGLAKHEVARFIELTTGTTPVDEMATSVFQETEGHPFFMTEMVRLLTTERPHHAFSTQGPTRRQLPRSIQSVIEQRLSHSSEECQRLLSIAAVIGREFSFPVLDLVAQTVQRDQTTVGTSSGTTSLPELLDEALAARLLTTVADGIGRYSFSHALIRDVLYHTAPTARRIRWHRAIGEALETLTGMLDESACAEIAHHFAQAAPGGGDAEKAITYTKRAADRAMESLAYEEAASHYDRALQLLDLQGPELPRRCSLLLDWGEAQHRAGNSPRAREIFQRAAELAKTLQAPTELARAALGFGGELLIPGRIDTELVHLLENALAAQPTDESTLRAQLLGRLAMELYHAPEPQQREQLSAQAVALAQRLGDTATLANVLSTRRYAIWAPAHLAERLTVTNDMVRLGRQLGHQGMELLGHHWRVIDRLERGDILGVEADIAEVARLAQELRWPFHLWYCAVFRAMRALLAGQLGEGERLAHQARAIGEHARLPVAMQMFGMQLFLIRREQGRLDELEPAVKHFAAQSSAFPVSRYLLAYCYSELERTEEARQVFAPLAAQHFADLPRDLNWLIGRAYAAEVSTLLNDTHAATSLYDDLSPYAAHFLVVGRAVICYGSVAHYLGMLATVMARWQEAEQHFLTAMQHHQQIEAPALLARTRYEYARMLLARQDTGDHEKAADLLELALTTAQALAINGLENKINRQKAKVKEQRGGKENSSMRVLDTQDSARETQHAATPPPAPQSLTPSLFLREGEYWTLTHQGVTARLKDTRGLHYLAQLLQHPHQEFHAAELVALVSGGGSTDNEQTAAEALQLDLTISTLGDAGEEIDPQAQMAYRQHLKELQEELAEAESYHDLGRIERVRQEIDFLTQELSRTIGLGGRRRKAASQTERARVNVTRTLRLAISKITEEHPTLGQHLTTAIRTGTFCAYAPNPHERLDWELIKIVDPNRQSS